MRGSRFTDEQIIGLLKEGEAGMTTAELCRRHGISPATFPKWKARYGGLGVSDAGQSRVAGVAPKKRVTPAARRVAVLVAVEELGLAQRRACGLTGISRSVAHYQRRSSERPGLKVALVSIKRHHPT